MSTRIFFMSASCEMLRLADRKWPAGSPTSGTLRTCPAGRGRGRATDSSLLTLPLPPATPGATGGLAVRETAKEKTMLLRNKLMLAAVAAFAAGVAPAADDLSALTGQRCPSAGPRGSSGRRG